MPRDSRLQFGCTVMWCATQAVNGAGVTTWLQHHISDAIDSMAAVARLDHTANLLYCNFIDLGAPKHSVLPLSLTLIGLPSTQQDTKRVTKTAQTDYS